jgi:2-keto-4-pentenoate hydratase/2-oxohepta-3-ene-1,7-dioic acid hydratase in catechol pathway
MSRTGKNIPEAEAYNYILGFTVGNDISSRYWQRQPYSGGQFCYAKSFDTFAPLGPTLLHPSQFSTEQTLDIRTLVNGETRQSSSTKQMIFSVAKIIAHASRGTTLRAGTVIMTGTPAGIAAKMPGEPWLKNGDIVEVEIEKIGRLRNRIVFES